MTPTERLEPYATKQGHSSYYFNNYIDNHNQDSVSKYADELDAPKYFLDCKLYQRSADVILGVPFNIASYALLVEFISQLVNMGVGKFIHSFGDVHIYSNHTPAFLEQVSREPKKLPTLKISDELQLACENLQKEDIGKDLFQDLLEEVLDNLVVGDFKIEGYISHPKIKAKLSTGLK